MKYIAVFLKRTENSDKNPSYEKVKEKKFDSTDVTIDWDKGAVQSHIDLYAFIDGNKKFYFYDYDSGDLISFATLVKSGLKPQDLKKFTGRSVIESIIRGINVDSGKMELIRILIPIVALVAGILIGHFVFPNNVPVPIEVPPTSSGV